MIESICVTRGNKWVNVQLLINKCNSIAFREGFFNLKIITNKSEVTLLVDSLRNCISIIFD